MLSTLNAHVSGLSVGEAYIVRAFLLVSLPETKHIKAECSSDWITLDADGVTGGGPFTVDATVADALRPVLADLRLKGVDVRMPPEKPAAGRPNAG
jgi:hypothetical protein